MLTLVLTVSALVHIYSIEYMAHDKSKTRFMTYLSLFTFCMVALVVSDNLIQLFFGWEGVGLASYRVTVHQNQPYASARLIAFQFGSQAVP